MELNDEDKKILIDILNGISIKGSDAEKIVELKKKITFSK
jgi:hypothetical protein